MVEKKEYIKTIQTNVNNLNNEKKSVEHPSGYRNSYSRVMM